MRLYLDPHAYCYEPDEWVSEAFARRFADLLDLMVAFKATEERVGGDHLFRFRWSTELAAGLYETYPFLTKPPKPFYQQQYQNTIFPELVRRMIECPDESCLGKTGTARPVPAGGPGTGALGAEFIRLLGQCAICSRTEAPCLVYHPDRCGVARPSAFFDREIALDHDEHLRLLDAGALFPIDPCERAAARLDLAVDVELAERQASDPTWADRQRARIATTELFWRSLHSADFQGRKALYATRLVYVILQIATGRDETISDHRMVNQTIRHEGRRHGRWNAHVFQSGANDQDRRCSRVYYAKTADGVLLDEFQPDAHS